MKHALITYFSLIHSREVIVTSSVLSCEAAKVTIEMYCIVLYIFVRKHVLYIVIIIGKIHGYFYSALQVVFALYFMAKEGSMGRMYKEWTLVGALTASGLPAAIYALQNSLLQISYKNLDSLTFSILNQTKIFFTALFTYFMLRYAPQ